MVNMNYFKHNLFLKSESLEKSNEVSMKKGVPVSLIQVQPPEVFYKTVFLKVSQNSHTCARVSFLMKLQAEACREDSGTGVLL